MRRQVAVVVAILVFIVAVAAKETPRLQFIEDTPEFQRYFGKRAHPGTVAGRKLLERDSYGIGEPVSDRFCGLDEETGECDFENYAKYLFALMIPGFVMAILSCLYIPVFVCGRCVCNCLGGKEPGKGLCMSNPDLFDGYEKNEIFGVKGLAAGVCVSVFACCIAGWVYNTQSTTGITGFIDAIIQAGQDVTDKVSAIRDILLGLEYTRDAAADLQPAIDAGNDVVQQGQDVKVEIEKYDSYRSKAINSSFAIPFIVMAFATFLGIINQKMCSICFSLLLCIGLVFLFLSLSVHRLVETVVADMCFEFDSLLTSNAEEQNNPALDQLVSCVENGDLGFDSFIETARQGISDAVSAGCNATTCLCYPHQCYPVPPEPSECPTYCNESNLNDFLDVTITEPVTGREVTIRECAEQCTNPQAQERAAGVVEAAEAVVEYVRVIDEEITPLLNCDFVTTLVDNVKEAVCVNLHDGTQGIKRSSGALCFFLMIGVIVLTLGQKRFISLDDDHCALNISKDHYGGPEDYATAGEMKAV